MNFINTNDYNEMSESASDFLINCLKQKPDTLFCMATGSSPTDAYRLFIQKVHTQNIDTKKMRIVKLDEWCGLPKDNPATCEFYIHKHLLKPLDISEDRYISFNPMEKNEEYECRRITALIKENGGIDCCVLGIGKNGHLGLNEPAQELPLFAHKAVLDPKTQTHSMLTSNKVTVSEGYTLGLKDILSSKKILLLITGSDKQNAYNALKKKTISSNHPANYLWLHDNTFCITDNASLSENNH